MIIIINAHSKVPAVLDKFNSFLLMQNLNLFISKNVLSFPTKKKIYTVLKSPHVNKTAQEKFKSEIYSKKYKIYSDKPQLLLKFLKIVESSLFEELFLKIQLVSSPKTSKLLFMLNPDKFLVEDNELKTYIEIFNGYGEVSLKQITK